MTHFKQFVSQELCLVPSSSSFSYLFITFWQPKINLEITFALVLGSMFLIPSGESSAATSVSERKKVVSLK